MINYNDYKNKIEAESKYFDQSKTKFEIFSQVFNEKVKNNPLEVQDENANDAFLLKLILKVFDKLIKKLDKAMEKEEKREAKNFEKLDSLIEENANKLTKFLDKEIKKTNKDKKGMKNLQNKLFTGFLDGDSIEFFAAFKKFRKVVNDLSNRGELYCEMKSNYFKTMAEKLEAKLDNKDTATL